MTSSGCAAEELRPQQGADGSFSLFSARFSEGFHGPIGALREAQTKFVRPAQLERFDSGNQLVVVDVGFGLGTNSAALREAAESRGVELAIWGLESDRQPLRQALATPAFRNQWHAGTVRWLEGLLAQEHPGESVGGVLWGDARRRLPELLGRFQLAASCDLVLLDAFSPQRCPELWSVEFLCRLAQLLKPEGRLLTYCCAAAVRQGLRLARLELASIPPPADLALGERTWSFGTAASPSPLEAGPGDGPLLPLTPMELEHLLTRAAEPYRDPDGQASAAAILAARQRAQAASSAPSTSAWRRRWGLEGAT